MSAAAIQGIVVLGGGRWARILLTVLRSVLNADTEILWVSNHGHESAHAWLTQNPIANLQLRRQLDFSTVRKHAVIIATSPETHYMLAQQAITAGLPTLCEKPLVADIEQARELLHISESLNCPLGLNLEFLNASYLHDFAAAIQDVTVTSVHIQWRDPWCEQRNGEKKYGEVYTDLMNDQLPHCWSVLTTVLPRETPLQITEVCDNAAGAEAIGTFGTVAIRCSLSRRADQRVRRVSVNDGQIVLDFSQEPGFTIQDRKTTKNTWSGARPLARTLAEFLDVANGPGRRGQWSLSLTSCFNAVESAVSSSALLRGVQDKQIAVLQLSRNLDSDNADHVRLIVDRFLPQFAAKGKRIFAHTIAEQRVFARTWQLSQGADDD